MASDLISRKSLLEKVQYRIDTPGIIGAIVRDMVATTRRIIEEEPAAVQWIPVTERLPANEEYVLVCTRSRNGSRNVDKGYCYNGGWAHRGTAEVTHWMPLPELPEKEVAPDGVC